MSKESPIPDGMTKRLLVFGVASVIGWVSYYLVFYFQGRLGVVVYVSLFVAWVLLLLPQLLATFWICRAFAKWRRWCPAVLAFICGVSLAGMTFWMRAMKLGWREPFTSGALAAISSAGSPDDWQKMGRALITEHLATNRGVMVSNSAFPQLARNVYHFEPSYVLVEPPHEQMPARAVVIWRMFGGAWRLTISTNGVGRPTGYLERSYSKEWAPGLNVTTSSE